MNDEEIQLLNPIVNGFIRCGFRVVGANDGYYHMFGLSSIPYVELELPMSKKIISVIVQYFYNVCDIYVRPDIDNSIGWTTKISLYEEIMLSDNKCIVRLSLPQYIADKIRKKREYIDCRKEFIDLFRHRMILFEQKILTMKL